ncbi:Tetraspanin-16 [Camelus dromedarius]|uniref:Tetraspanin-16 n=1 Tax=Camelus dromedarius TaxID=9838 RepID=A0A5N4CKI8_CAMDR|nr:Tetraspanin-16 [Camelus dromedarius]
MAEMHTPYYSLKKLLSFFNGFVAGCVTALLGFAGYYGATKESRGTLLFCFLFMVIILMVEITVATVVLAFFLIVKYSTAFPTPH